MSRSTLGDHIPEQSFSKPSIPIFCPGHSEFFISMGRLVNFLRTIAALPTPIYHDWCINTKKVPYNKLYFDIDCIRCKMKEPHLAPPNLKEHYFFLKNNILSFLADVIKHKNTEARTSFIQEYEQKVSIGVNPAKPTCGAHVLIDITTDVFARPVLQKNLLGKPIGETHLMDWPANLLIPGGRFYTAELTESGTVIPLSETTITRFLPISFVSQTENVLTLASCSGYGFCGKFLTDDEQPCGDFQMSPELIFGIIISKKFQSNLTWSKLEYDNQCFEKSIIQLWEKSLQTGDEVCEIYELKSAMAQYNLPCRVIHTMSEHDTTEIIPMEDEEGEGVVAEMMEGTVNGEWGTDGGEEEEEESQEYFHYTPQYVEGLKKLLDMDLNDAERVRRLITIKIVAYMGNDVFAFLNFIEGGGLQENPSGGSSKKRKRKSSEGENEPTDVPAMASVDGYVWVDRLLRDAIFKGAYTSVIATAVSIGGAALDDACAMVFALSERNRKCAYICSVILTIPKLRTFFEKNYTSCDLIYFYFCDKFKTTSTLLQFNKVGKQYDALKSASIFKKFIFVLRQMGSGYCYFNGEALVIDRENKLKKLYEKMDNAEIQANATTLTLSYSYRTPYGIYNPLWGTFEINGPALNELIYRNLTSISKQKIKTMDYSLSVYAAQVFFSIPKFIESIRAQIVPLILQAPLLPSFENYPDFSKYQNNPIKPFAIQTFQTEPADLAMSFNHIWPEDFMDRLQNHSRLWKFTKLTLSILYTLGKYVDIDPRNPLVILLNLFGKKNHLLLGVERFEWTGRSINVFKEMSADTKEPAKSDVEENLSSSFADSVSIVKLLQKKLEVIKNKKLLAEKLSAAVEQDTNLINLETEYYCMSSVAIETIDLLALFSKISIKNFDDDGFMDRIETTSPDLVKTSLLLLSWFIKMGDQHPLTQHPYFKGIQTYRRELYAELVALANSIARISSATTLEDIIEIYDVFMDTHKCILNDAIDLMKMREYPEEIKYWCGNLTYDETADPEHLKYKIKEAAMYLVKGGNFSHDYFIELSKIIAYMEYLGNPQRLAYNLYGESSSGKSFFGDLLHNVFQTDSGYLLSSRTFCEGNRPTDNDQNAIALGTNFLTILNEDELLSVEIFKKYVDFNKLATRDIHKTCPTTYPIRAKVILTSNSPVRVNKPSDLGFKPKFYPIHFNYDFVDALSEYDRIIKHKIETMEAVTTPLLAGQILLRRYAREQCNSIADGIILFSRHLLRWLFFSTPELPVSKQKTAQIRDNYEAYFNNTCPLQKFFNTVTLNPSPKNGYDEATLRRILMSWWEQYRFQFKKIKDNTQIFDNIMAKLSSYKVGKKYQLEIVLNNKI